MSLAKPPVKSRRKCFRKNVCVKKNVKYKNKVTLLFCAISIHATKRNRTPSTSFGINVTMAYHQIRPLSRCLFHAKMTFLTNCSNLTKNECQLPPTWNPGIPDAPIQITKLGPTRKRKEGRPREYNHPRMHVHEDIRFKER